MTPTRPVLYGIPFSHYCQKAEWGLTQAGIPYDYVSISLPKMVDLPNITATGLVPAMDVNGRLLEGSDRILAWAADHAALGTTPLRPSGLEDAVHDWESWAGDAIGPVARREAYRVAYKDPWHFTRNPGIRMAAWVARPLVLNVLKHLKARRYDDTDLDAVPIIIAKVAARLQETGTGFLLTDHATTADHAVAALARPLLYAAPGRDYASIDGWAIVEDFVRGVKPKKTLRGRKRRFTAREKARLRSLANAAGPS